MPHLVTWSQSILSPLPTKLLQEWYTRTPSNNSSLKTVEIPFCAEALERFLFSIIRFRGLMRIFQQTLWLLGRTAIYV